MNGRIFRMDIPAHQAVQELLPWYAREQLTQDDAERVRAHLETCMQCRHELAWEHDMRGHAALEQDTAAPTPAGLDMEAALARLLPSLGEQEQMAATSAGTAGAAAATTIVTAPGGAASEPARLPWWRRPAANQGSWMGWTMAAQWGLIAGLLVLLMRPESEPAAYRVLGAQTATGGNIVVMFQPETSERELRRILQAQGARVVDGPTVTDAYLISVPAAARQRALLALRADAAVRLAEALDGGTAP